jgi:ribose transport system ATP-binding protein
MLEFRHITKAFFGVTVVQDVSFQLAPGRILGLVGENGAGKSTLMNILGGNQQPDSGTLLLDGAPFAPRHPQDAARHGIALIHQELNLFTNLTVAENLYLTRFPTRRPLPLIRRGPLHEETTRWLARVGLEVPPDTPVDTLSAGECQLVEIARALSTDARVIVFDEPTTSLAHRECTRLFALIRELRDRGHAVIFISHNLDDVLQLCDDVVVLRDGRRVGAGEARTFTTDSLVSLMVGRSLSQLFPTRTCRPERDPVLELRHVCQPGVVEDISFTLHRGEVLGLAGLMGSGRSELARIIFGLDPYTHGEVLRDGQPLPRRPAASIECGVAFLTEDRRQDGLFLDASILDNMALLTLPRHAAAATGWLDLRALAGRVAKMREAVRITAHARLDQPVKTLSGGNQQKVVLARWLLSDPAVLILDEPTRGIDVGAKAEIYQLINDAAARGAGVLVISSELEELIGLCDRILVMNRGEICDEIARAGFNRERILRAALHQRATAASVIAPAGPLQPP